MIIVWKAIYIRVRARHDIKARLTKTIQSEQMWAIPQLVQRDKNSVITIEMNKEFSIKTAREYESPFVIVK